MYFKLGQVLQIMAIITKLDIATYLTLIKYY